MIMEIDEELGIYAAVPLAYVAAPETTPDDRLMHINSLSMNCSCHVFKSHSVCPHLLAVVDEDEVDTLLAVLEGPNVLLPLRRQRRIGTSPELEPTQDSVDEVTKLRDIREQAFTAADFEDQDAAAIAAMCRDIPRFTQKMHPAQKLAVRLKLQVIFTNLRQLFHSTSSLNWLLRR